MEEALTKSPQLKEIPNSSLMDACALRVINNLIDQPLLQSQICQEKLPAEVKEAVKKSFITRYRCDLCLYGTTLTEGYQHTLSLTWNPKKHLALSTSNTRCCILWELRDLDHINPLILDADHSNQIFSTAWSPCGNYALSGSCKGSVKLWDFSDLTKNLSRIRHQDLPGHQGPVTVVAWSPDGSSALSACEGDYMWLLRDQPQGTNDTTIKLWNVQNLQNITSINLEGHTRGITQLLWSPDSRFFLSSSADGTVRLWDCANRSHITSRVLIQEIDQRNPAMAWNSDGTQAVISHGTTLTVWNLQNLNDIKAQVLIGHKLPISSIAWSPHGRFIISSAKAPPGRDPKEDSTILLWDLKNPQRGPFILSSNTSASPLTWSSNGSFILSRDEGGHAVKVWNCTDLRQVAALLPGHNGWIRSIILSHDNKLALSYSGFIGDTKIMLWNLNPVADLDLPQLILVGKLINALKAGTVKELLKNDPLAREILKGLPNQLKLKLEVE